MPNIKLPRPRPRRRGLLTLAAVLTVESLTPTAAAQAPADTTPATVAAPASAGNLDTFAARLHDAPADELDALWEEADALVEANPDDPHAVEVRRWTREKILVRSLPMFSGRLEARLTAALAEEHPDVDYTSIAAHLDAIVGDLALEHRLTSSERIAEIRSKRATQAQRAHEYAEPPPLLPARAVTLKPTRALVQSPPQDLKQPVKRPPEPSTRVGNILGTGFMLAGLTTVFVSSFLLLGESVTSTDTGQFVQAPKFATGATLAIGGGALLGGGTGLVVASAVARDPGKRRPIRQASWVFLASAVALGAGATYLALDARQQWQTTVAAEGPPAFGASDIAFNKAAILGGLALSQLGIFAGMHAATRDRDARTGRAYSVRPIPPSIGLSRGGAMATVGLRF